MTFICYNHLIELIVGHVLRSVLGNLNLRIRSLTSTDEILSIVGKCNAENEMTTANIQIIRRDELECSSNNAVIVLTF